MHGLILNLGSSFWQVQPGNMRIRILTPFRSVYAELFYLLRAVDLRLLLLLNITEVRYP